MNMPDFFREKWEGEQPAFGRVLRALPADQLSYRPHERSNTAAGIAWQLVEEQRSLADVIEKGSIQWEMRPMPDSLDGIVAGWDAATEKLRAQLASVDDAKWSGNASMSMGGDAAWTDTVGNMLWGFLLDMIHHRGQLSAYIRPMGGKVPSIYGPSADS
ncbi:MAG TPA: DinB family protein [Thermoanaerobaculia bacterium]|nr:DinB family protein [Thermoanaerobaculia bacterium]